MEKKGRLQKSQGAGIGGWQTKIEILLRDANFHATYH